MDMTSLSEGDLEALSRGDMQSVSEEGLRALAGRPSARDLWQQELKKNVAEMSPVEQGLVGVGKAFVDVGRGAKQLLNIGDQEALKREIEESRVRDAPILDTGAGMAGNVLGNVAAFAPAAFIPGANTLIGATLIGGASGALSPTVTTQEALMGPAIGAAAGPAGLLAGRGAAALTGTARGLLEPLTARGQERIAQRIYSGFAGGGDRARQAATNIRSAADLNIPGYQPTAAELANNPGVAQLQRSLLNNPDVNSAITGRAQANRGALESALTNIAGDEAQLAAATTARGAAVRPLYDALYASNIMPDQQFTALAQRPAMQEAIRRAEGLAAEGGAPASPGEFLHNVKMALDDMLETGPQRGVGGREAGRVRATRNQFVNWFERQSPDFEAANRIYREMSQPVGQMQIGQELVERFRPALADYGANTRTTAETYARSLRNADETARRATGFEGATMRGLLAPQAMETVENVGRALGRRVNAEELGRAPGSPTAQNLIAQNFIQQVAGPLGLPQTLSQNVLAQTLARPIQWAGRLAEPRVVQRLAEIGLNPQEAADILSRAADPDRALEALLRRQSLLGTSAAALGASNAAQQ
ncbi:hypothetical protein [Sphingomonas sp.]|jgi:hypothetical protein|uniref:hypothetical protein n=1 Tax=Sphingomonas sp. TaxID=28214 RepID=UPI003568D1D3